MKSITNLFGEKNVQLWYPGIEFKKSGRDILNWAFFGFKIWTSSEGKFRCLSWGRVLFSKVQLFWLWNHVIYPPPNSSRERRRTNERQCQAEWGLSPRRHQQQGYNNHYSDTPGRRMKIFGGFFFKNYPILGKFRILFFNFFQKNTQTLIF